MKIRLISGKAAAVLAWLAVAGTVGCANPIEPVARLSAGGNSASEPVANMLIGRWSLVDGDRMINWEFREDGSADREEWLAEALVDFEQFDSWRLEDMENTGLFLVIVSGYDGELYVDGTGALVDGEDGTLKTYDRLF